MDHGILNFILSCIICTSDFYCCQVWLVKGMVRQHIRNNCYAGESGNFIRPVIYYMVCFDQQENKINKDGCNSFICLCHNRIDYFYCYGNMVQGAKLGILLVPFTMAGSIMES